MRSMKSEILLILTIWFCVMDCYSQAFNKKDWVSQDNKHLIIDPKSQPELIQGEKLLSVLLLSPAELKPYYNPGNNSFISKRPLSVMLRTVDLVNEKKISDTLFSRYLQIIQAPSLEIYGLRFDHHLKLIFANIKIPEADGPLSTFTIKESYFLGELKLQNIDARTLISHNHFKSGVEFSNLRGSLLLSENSIVESVKVYVNGSKLKLTVDEKNIKLRSTRNTYEGVDIKVKSLKGSKLNFDADTFNSNISIVGHTVTNRKNDHHVQFENCKLRESVDIGMLNVKRLSLINCNLESSNKLTWYTTIADTFELELFNINFSKLDFNVSAQTKLYFSPQRSQEEVEQVYLSLLSKFQNEGKALSYKNVDIQYKAHKWNEFILIGPVLNFIDKWWWNYGYNSNRIIIITISLLFIFYVFNLVLNDSLLAFYPIFAGKRGSSRIRPNKRNINHFVVMFILTVYIFLSLRVDFSKLDMTKTRMLIYFFVQYFIGLICLLFLFGYIFKL